MNASRKNNLPRLLALSGTIMASALATPAATFNLGFSSDTITVPGTLAVTNEISLGGSSRTTWPGNGLNLLPVEDFASWTLMPQIRGLYDYTMQFTFGGPGVWDPSARLYRHFFGSGYTTKIFSMTSPDGINLSDVAAALTPDTIDPQEVNVPFAWYESGTVRPWRMLYRGESNNLFSIFLTTSTNGTVWERKDTAAVDLTAPVLTYGSTNIDFGNVFSYNGLYYLYFNTISARHTMLATSTDLVTWSIVGGASTATHFFDGKTNASGAWDYDDKTHTGFAAYSGAGWFCPWVGRCDDASGNVQFITYIPTYVEWTPAYRAALACFTSPSPYFYATNRTFRGLVWDPRVNKSYLGGFTSFAGCDVPRLQCDDITQDMGRSKSRLLWISAKIGTNNYWSDMILHRPASVPISTENTNTTGWTADAGIGSLLPGNKPALHLALATNTTTVFVWQPGATHTTLDLSGYGYHPAQGKGPLKPDPLGAYFTGASNSYFFANTETTPPAQLRLTKNLTIQFEASKSAVLGAGVAASPFAITGGTGKHIALVYLNGSASDTAVTWTFTVTDTGGTSRSYTTAAFNWAAGERHHWAFSVTGGKIYWFKDGVLQNAGGSAYNWDIKDETGIECPLKIGIAGTFATPVFPWFGYIDNVRLDNDGLYTASFTPATTALNYATTGKLYSRVFDIGQSGTPELSVTASVPSTCSLTVTRRLAANATDKSQTAGDFGTSSSAGRYHQFCVTLSGDGSSTPQITDIHLNN